MRTKAPSLAPLFRSQHQLRLLGELFVGSADTSTVNDLARRIGAHQTTVSREVQRLAQAGLVTVRRQGRNQLVAPNRLLPWYRELRSLLAQTVGPPALLGRALADLTDVKHAAIFGSWAARYLGEPGPFPNDIDVIVLDAKNAEPVYRACRDVESEVKVDVNPVLVTSDEWDHAAPNSFLGQVRSGPLVPITLEERTRR